MKRHLIPNTRQYKANLHCHSTISDGALTPEELKTAYAEKGYAVLAYSDHNKLVPHPELKDDTFLPITSIEIDITEKTPDWYTARTYHLNFFSKEEKRDKFVPVDRVYDKDVINNLIWRARADGFLAQYNHPRWSLQLPEDYLPIEGLSTFEIFNTGADMIMVNGYGDAEYEAMLRRKNQIAPVACDDNHNRAKSLDAPESDSFRAFTMLCMEKLNYDLALSAIENGRLYASTGPKIHEFSVENGKILIRCSPAVTLALLTESRRAKIKHSHAPGVTQWETEIDFAHDFQYIRLIVIDERGNRALTKAYSKIEILG